MFEMLRLRLTGAYRTARSRVNVEKTKVFIIHRGWTVALALVLAVTGIVAIFGNPSVVGVAAAKRDLPIYCVGREDKHVSISFDAAWGNEDTQQLIDILATYDVKATFFIVGDWVTKYPESVKALADAGHEIMNHSDKHKHMPRLSATEIAADINACNDKIEAITGVRPTLFRPPYGEYDNKLVGTLRELGMYTIQWDVDSLDWKDLTAQQIQERVVSRVKSGSIVLFHNAALHTPAALPGIIEALQADGYTLVKISDLIHTGEFTIDHAGKQITG